MDLSNIEPEKVTIEFADESENDNFEQLPVRDAEILVETPLDDFTIFLESLPDDSNPSIIITRQPDRNYAGQFRIPCESQEHSGTLNWNNYTDASEIYNDVAKEFGGGRYSIQVKDGQRFEKNRTWTTTIADPVNLSEKEKTLLELKTKTDEQLRTVENSQLFANPVPVQNELPRNSLKDAIEQIKDLKEFQNLLMPPSPPPTEQPAAQPTTPPITKETIKMAIIEKALNNENLLEKAIEAVFDIAPEAVETQGGALVEIFKYAASHTSETKAILEIAVQSVGSLIMPFIPKPPAVLPTIRQNGLQRFKKPADTPTAESVPKNEPQPQQTAKNQPPAAALNIILDEFQFIEG